LAGHNDVLAGALLGKKELVQTVRGLWVWVGEWTELGGCGGWELVGSLSSCDPLVAQSAPLVAQS